ILNTLCASLIFVQIQISAKPISEDRNLIVNELLNFALNGSCWVCHHERALLWGGYARNSRLAQYGLWVTTQDRVAIKARSRPSGRAHEQQSAARQELLLVHPRWL